MFGLVGAALAATVALGGVQSAPAAGGGLDPRTVQAFVARLQRAIAGNDKRAVAALAAYPTRVMVSGLDVPILNASELVRLFDIVFTPDMRCAIGQARLDVAGRPQARVPVSVAADGVSIGAGMIWAQLTAGALKIHRIIVRQSTVVQPSRPPPRRIEFPDPALPLREAFSGRLAHDRVDSYVLSAKRGQVLEATIGGFRGRDAALSVLDHRTGTSVAAPPQGRAADMDGGAACDGPVPDPSGAHGALLRSVVHLFADRDAALNAVSFESAASRSRISGPCS